MYLNLKKMSSAVILLEIYHGFYPGKLNAVLARETALPSTIHFPTPPTIHEEKRVGSSPLTTCSRIPSLPQNKKFVNTFS